MTSELNQCDCCDYFTIEAGHDYEICPVCFWEQDHFGFELLDEPSGANHGLTIREARENFRKYGACSRELVGKTLSTIDRNRLRYAPRHLTGD